MSGHGHAHSLPHEEAHADAWHHHEASEGLPQAEHGAETNMLSLALWGAALVVTVGTGADEAIIGSATYVAGDAADGPRTAEVAFTIEEDYQGQGLAGRLLAGLVDIARRHGIQGFKAEVLAHNGAMLAVFKRSGLPMQMRPAAEVVHVSLSLLPQG